MLLLGYVALTTFFEVFGIKGQYGLLGLGALPRSILGLLIVGLLLYGLVYVIVAIGCLRLYLLLELAYIYVVADDTLSAGGALRKAGTRLGSFFWAIWHGAEVTHVRKRDAANRTVRGGSHRAAKLDLWNLLRNVAEKVT